MADLPRSSADGKRPQSDEGLRRQVAALQEELGTRQREAQRRLRNMLAMIRSIIRRTGEDATSLEDYHLRLEGRIAAFTRVQAILLSDQNIGIALFSLVADERLLAALDDCAIEVRGEDMALSPAAANLLVLLIHELVQRLPASEQTAFPLAILHAAFADDDARDTVIIDWTERVVASPAPSPSPAWLDDALVYELNARIEPIHDSNWAGSRYRIPAHMLLSNAGFLERFPGAESGPSARN